MNVGVVGFGGLGHMAVRQVGGARSKTKEQICLHFVPGLWIIAFDFAMSGGEAGLRACYAVCGTELAYGAMECA
eukprot:351017-Rhodomonas_salina.3